MNWELADSTKEKPWYSVPSQSPFQQMKGHMRMNQYDFYYSCFLFSLFNSRKLWNRRFISIL